MKKREEIATGRGRGIVPSAFTASALRASKVDTGLVWQVDELTAENHLRKSLLREDLGNLALIVFLFGGMVISILVLFAEAAHA